MKRSLALLALTAASVVLAERAPAQTPVAQLSVPPADADRFVIVSSAGQHGTSALWRTPDGRVVMRESMNVRGQVWELDQTIHFGADGLPDRIEVRGITPEGDAAETFQVTDGTARWETPIDAGSARPDARSYYATYGGTWSSFAPFIESLFNEPGHELSLLPSGKARLARLTELTIGEGTARRTVTAYTVEGLWLTPVPVWMDGARFFGQALEGMGLVREGYADAFQALQNAQDQALAARGPEMVRRFGQVPATPVAFTNVRLFDAEAGRFLDNQTVIAEKGKIVAVGSADSVEVSGNARVIDGSGKSLVPGLWDAHNHLGDDSHGLLLLSLGVTSARNPAAQVEQTTARNARIASGDLLYPTVYSSLMIDGAGPLQANGAVTVTSTAEAVAAVRMAQANGFAGIKFYSSLKREWLVAAIAEAKQLGLHIHGHLPVNMRPMDAIDLGYDEITHINMVMMQAMPDEVVAQLNTMLRIEGPGRYAKDIDIAVDPLKSLIAEMSARQITVDPTIATFEGGYVPESGDLSPAYAPFMGTMPPTTERGFRAGGLKVSDGLTRDDYRASFEKMVALVAALHEAGVPIVAGTDGIGLEIVRELELYVQAGLTPAEALQTATIAPARLLKVDATTGSITVGKDADLVLVDGDPSRRIGDLRHTLWVMSKGRLMNAQALREAAGFSGPPK